MTISEAAERVGLSSDTLRYYEKIGLVPQVKRDRNGNRTYTESNCNWLFFIKCMRRAGLSIDALVEYISLLEEGDGSRERRKAILINQRKLLLEQIDDIRDTIGYLDFKIQGYEEFLVKKEEELIEESQKETESMGA